MNQSVQRLQTHVTGQVYWRYVERAPSGKVLLLTIGGVATFGDWKEDAGFLAWSPMPKRDKLLEKALGLNDFRTVWQRLKELKAIPQEELQLIITNSLRESHENQSSDLLLLDV